MAGLCAKDDGLIVEEYGGGPDRCGEEAASRAATRREQRKRGDEQDEGPQCRGAHVKERHRQSK